jgi:hypothetical protein
MRDRKFDPKAVVSCSSAVSDKLTEARLVVKSSPPIVME